MGSIYITIKKRGDSTLYYDALQVNRPDVNSFYGHANNIDNGFSRIIDIKSLNGNYIVGFVRLNNGYIEECQFEKGIYINHGDISDFSSR